MQKLVVEIRSLRDRMVEGIYTDVGGFELGEMDREEMTVVVYFSEDAVRDQDNVKTLDTNTRMETRTQQSTDVRTGSRCSRRAVVCLGLLCVLLLTTNIVLYMYHIKDQPISTAERETLLSSTRNLTEERDQLKNSYQNLTEERDQLKNSYQNLTEERDQLKNSYQNLTEEKMMLQTRYDHLAKLTENVCFKEWKKNRSSFYFFSTEKKTWSDSRQHCRERGADLVIINSREEQMFLIDQNKEKRTFWMGLTDIHTEDTWKWVDDQPLTEQFWRKGEPSDSGGKEDCAVFTIKVEDGQRNWNDLHCSDTQNWICEFNMTNFN